VVKWDTKRKPELKITVTHVKGFVYTTKYTLTDHKRNQVTLNNLKPNHFWKKLTPKKINGYNKFAKWTVPELRLLL